MSTPLPPPQRETERLAALYRYEILDTPPEKELDDIVHLASYICHTPISLISLVDSSRQWFKSKVGLTATETSRYIAFCAHAILGDDLLIVPDALADERFADNPLVTGDPPIRFYCGAPLVTPEGHRIGTLSVIDHVPRTLSAEQQEMLRAFRRQVIEHLMLNRCLREVTRAHRSEDNFRTLIELSPSAIFIYRDDRIVYANQAAAFISGYSIEELLAMDLWKRGHPDVLPFLQARDQAPQESDISPVRDEFQIITKDGKKRWLEVTQTTIDYEGRPARLAAAYDITVHKQAELAAGTRERMLQLILDAEPECVKLLAPGGILLSMNKAGLAMVEAETPEQVMNQCMYPLIMEPYRPQFQALTERVFQGESGILEFEVGGLKGGRRWLETHAEPLRDKAGKVTALLSVTRDITERKESEALLETDKRILELIASGASLTEVLEQLCRMFEEMSPGLLASVLLLEQDRRHLRHGAAPNLPPAYCAAIDNGCIGPSAGSCGTAAYLHRQVIVTDIANDPLWTEYRDLALNHHLRACWSTPIFSKDASVLGTFAMYYREPRIPSAYDLQISEHATALATIAIERVRTVEMLRENETLLGLFVEHAPAALGMFDRKMCYLYASRRWRSDYGLGARTLRGASHYDVFPECSGAWKEAHRRGLAGEVLRKDVDRFERTNGDVQWLRWEIRPWFESSGTIGGIVIFTEDITDEKRAVDALQESYRRLQVLSHEVRMAEEKERIRLSRELHDEFGQLLSALKLDVNRIADDLADKPALKPSVVRKKLIAAAGIVDRLFSSLQEMIHGLRPAVLEELGLLPAIQALANERQERSGLRCHVVADQEDFGKSFGPELEGALFRIAQELLTNIIRHAKATTATITLSSFDGWAYLAVQDDGQGLKVRSHPSKHQFGLRGIGERAELLGGNVEFRSKRGQGTTITVRIPVEPTFQGNGSSMVPSRTPMSVAKKKRRRHGK